MNTLSHLDGRGTERLGSHPADVDLPGWEEFTAARDRFFAGLASAAELYRNAPSRLDDASRENTNARDRS